MDPVTVEDYLAKIVWNIQQLSVNRLLFYTFPLHRRAYRLVHQTLGKWAGKFVQLVDLFVDQVFIAAG